MATIQLVQNDTRPWIEFTVTSAGTAVNLTGGTAIFRFRKADGASVLFSRPCTLTNPAAGKCRYSWQTGDLAEPGDYVGELEIIFSDGTVQTCSEVLRFSVRREL